MDTIRIISDPHVCWGSPVIEGTRISAEILSNLVAAGDSIESVADNYGIEPRSVRRAVAFIDMIHERYT